MPGVPNKLSQFWQELKRRKVTRTITVYAAAAFVTLELVSIIVEPLRLPEWTLSFIIVLLCVGFIIAVILSWIYDIHPEGGIVKTEPVRKAKEAPALASSKGWKIASYISFVVIVALIVLNIIPRTNNKKILEKSIAVLPLEYLSEDPDKQYLADGVLDAITGHLSLIEGLRVMPRTSVEQYRENKKSAKEIGEELDVSYLIEGSFLMIEDQVKLIIQLVVAKEGDHIFFKEYDRNYNDIIVVQSEVAKTIAKEIEIALTPEEIKLIEKKPTTNLTAYDFYLKGEEKLFDWWLDRDSIALFESENLFKRALDYDSTYALAYARLAWFSYYKVSYKVDYYSENFLDSAIILADIALSYDPQLAEAYDIKGNTLGSIGETELALEAFEKAIKYNPNFFEAYWSLGVLYREIEKFDLAIHNLYQASILHRGEFLPALFRDIATVYLVIGFEEQGKSYNLEAFKLHRDTILYIITLADIELVKGNFSETIKYLKDAYTIDSTSMYGDYLLAQIAYNYIFLGRPEESLKYYKKLETEKEVSEWLNSNQFQRLGYVYWQLGMKKEANFYFDERIRTCIKENELGRLGSKQHYTYYDLAGVYAFRGEKDQALENLRIFNQKRIMPKWMVTLIQNDPMFNSIRDEPEFQQILSDVEAKYQAEHERVRQWLEENDML